jgi:Ca2+-binding RTX toxin-like protein
MLLVALAVCAPAAMASDLTYDGDALVYTGGDDDSHGLQFRLDLDTGRDHVLDTEVIDTFPDGCAWETSAHNWVSCPGSLVVRVELGAGHDEVIFRQGNTLHGEGSNDRILAAFGNDVEDGGPGDDTSPEPRGPTTSTASRAATRGGGGNDTLIGSDGDDSVFGDAGNDHVEGRYGVDMVEGGPGTDELYGDIDGCVQSCEPDTDSLFAQDGERDVVRCGGPGTAHVDQLDVVASCATVDRVDAGGGGNGNGDGDGGDISVRKADFGGSKRSVTVSRQGRFSYSFRGGAGLSGEAVFASAGKVRLSRKARVTLGRRSFTVPAGGTVKLKMRLSGRNLAILRRNRKIRTKVTVTLANSEGGSSVASGTVTLKR